MSCLNRLSLSDSFFCLSRKDPELGFNCDLTSIAGCVVGAPASGARLDHHTYLRLLLGSHLAHHLRLRLETDFGYTATCGISTNKVLSKLVGSCNKPRNQTTLPALRDDDVTEFMDRHKVRQVPGLGFKTALLLESYILGQPLDADSHLFESTLTVGEVRQHQAISPSSLESLLGGPGAERGIGQRVWGLLHGVDPTEVKEASNIPSQISIEDTYQGLETMPQIVQELHKLSCSLVRRMRVDLVVRDGDAITPDAQRWIARPKTLRLSSRSWPTRQGSDRSFSRVSRSGPLPSLVFDLEADVDDMAQQLVAEALLPLLRRMQGDKAHKWNLQLLNVCVANMIPGAADDRSGAGRDIGVMFKTQDEVLLPWRVTGNSENESDDSLGETAFEEPDMSPTWDSTVHSLCPQCGHFVPQFAMPAHARYHELEG
ncbi:hypothetical protein G6O67_001517 [Ophiocordyceps sinensis]|nr:hypothetical protein G6O67_001517 [Ophiocordyceps sinensis]